MGASQESIDSAGETVGAQSTPAPASAAPPTAALLSTPSGIQALQRTVGNAAVGRLLRSSQALGRQSWPAGRHPLAVLARDLQSDQVLPHVVPMDAPAERELGSANERPPGGLLFGAYSPVSYDTSSYFHHPDEHDPKDVERYWRQRNEMWAFFGGTVGMLFGAKDPANPKGPEGAAWAPKHTCAARLSYALNRIGSAARIRSGNYIPNDRNVSYAGKAGDGMNYIVGAPAMQEYLRSHWGRADRTLTTNEQAANLRGDLGAGGVAVFAGPDHVGLITQRLQEGHEYVYGDPGVLPVTAWILPDK